MEKVKTRNLADAIIALTALVLAGVLVSAAFVARAGVKAAALENVYQKALYDLAANVSNIEVKLGKLTVSADPANERQLAADIWRQAHLAADNAAQLPLGREQISETVKFINQTGDFGHSLVKKLNAGRDLSDADARTLENLRRRGEDAARELAAAADGLRRGRYLHTRTGRETLAGGRTGGIADNFAQMEKLSADYPKMIYDGPFSDGLSRRVFKALEGKSETSEKEAADKLRNILKDAGVKKIEFLGNAGGEIPTREFSVVTDKGTFYAQTSARGALPLMLSSDRPTNAAAIDEERAVKIAEKFAADAGFEDMRGVWANVTGGVAYVNLATENEDVVIYPELVKVKVAADDGTVLGFEAGEYARNHAAGRRITAPSITEGEALAKISKKLDVKSVRRAVIPKGADEVSTYEIACRHNGFDYFVYINAETGAEEEIMRVVDGNQGKMII